MLDTFRRLGETMQPTDENWEERVKAMKTIQVGTFVIGWFAVATSPHLAPV